MEEDNEENAPLESGVPADKSSPEKNGRSVYAIGNSSFFKPNFWTLLSIILATSFFFVNYKTLDIGYIIYEPTKIVESNNTSQIQVLFNDSIIEENIYSTKIEVANYGSESLSKDKMRTPISITVSGGGTILNYEITKERDSEVANFSLSDFKKDLYVGADTVYFDYDYFDEGFGLQADILYTGDDDSSLEINGKFENNKHPKKKSFRSNGIWLIILFFIYAFTFENVVEYVYDKLSKKIKRLQNSAWIYYTIRFVVSSLYFCAFVLLVMACYRYGILQQSIFK